MSEQTPRKGDTVLVSFKATWDQDRGSHYWLRDLADGSTMSVPSNATVEVLERAECGMSEGMSGIACQLPKDHIMPDGSLRTVHEGTTTAEQAKTAGYEIFVRWPVNGTTLPVAPAADEMPPAPWSVLHTYRGPDGVERAHTGPREQCADDECREPEPERELLEQEAARNADGEYPEVSGAGVPYPPVDPLSLDARQRVAALLVDGRKSDAIRLVAAVGMPHDKAKAYVEAMPEYQTCLNHHTRTVDVSAPEVI